MAADTRSYDRVVVAFSRGKDSAGDDDPRLGDSVGTRGVGCGSLEVVMESFVSGIKRTTGGDPIEGADPGGTRSTKPGNPDKSGAAKPEEVREKRVSGDRNEGISSDVKK